MKIRKFSRDGVLKVHIEDWDRYEVTEDNGVDLWLSPEQLKKLAEYAK
jgi:hypothetical protein